jgi:hypothetical protein
METKLVNSNYEKRLDVIHVNGDNRRYTITGDAIVCGEKLADLTEAEKQTVIDFKALCNSVCEKYPLPETLKKVLYKASLNAFTILTMSDFTVIKTEAEIPVGEVEGVSHEVIIQMYKDLCISIKEGYADSKWERTDDYGVLYVDEVVIDVISAEDNVKQVIYLTGEMLKKCL